VNITFVNGHAFMIGSFCGDKSAVELLDPATFLDKNWLCQ
jgi:hypothetical protein